MVKISFQQKPYRRSMMHMWDASVTASPSDETEAGRDVTVEDDVAALTTAAVAEHAEFAAMCKRLGIVFIGPTAEQIRRMADAMLGDSSDDMDGGAEARSGDGGPVAGDRARDAAGWGARAATGHRGTGRLAGG